MITEPTVSDRRIVTNMTNSRNIKKSSNFQHEKKKKDRFQKLLNSNLEVDSQHNPKVKH